MAPPEDRMARMFERLDADNDGAVSQQEMEKMRERMGNRHGEEHGKGHGEGHGKKRWME